MQEYQLQEVGDFLIGLAGVKRIKRELSMEKARDEAHKPRSRSHFGSVDIVRCVKLAFGTVQAAIPPELSIGYV